MAAVFLLHGAALAELKCGYPHPNVATHMHYVFARGA